MSIGKLPKVLSFQRGIINSDGIMYNCFAGTDSKLKKVRVVRHGMLGTQGDNNIALPQITESAKTEPEAEGLLIRYSIGFLPLHNLLFSTSDPEFAGHCKSFIDRFLSSDELAEISKRYARNILNGRWFYRNAELETSREVKVTFLDSDIDPITIGSRTDLGFASSYMADEEKLGAEIAKCLKGASKMRFLVEGRINFGFRGAIEVFPSQNYVSNKPKGFARPLYKVGVIENKELDEALKDLEPSSFRADLMTMGFAALRDQKIGNALRTIDTWYDNGKDLAPISIEPSGASLKDNVYYRKNKNSAYELLGYIDELKPGEGGKLNKDAMFVLAIMVRGGVFSGKKDSN